jgi:glycogen(starch) synthase
LKERVWKWIPRVRTIGSTICLGATQTKWFLADADRNKLHSFSYKPNSDTSPVIIAPPSLLTAAADSGRKTPAPPVAGKAEKVSTMRSLQLGLGWFPEQPGGLDRYYYDLLRALPGAGVECRGLLVGSDAVATATAGVVRAFANRSEPALARWRAARSAVKAGLWSERFDLVVAHFALYAFPVLGLIGDLPLVVHFHGPWAAECRVEGGGRAACWLKSRIERAVYNRADRLICLSEAFAEILHRDYGVRRDRISVIPGGVEIDRFNIPESRTQARARLGWSAQRPTILCVRRLVRRMGLENLVDAAVVLRKDVPDVQILIAGRGPQSSQLQGRIVQEGLQDTVKLLGFIPDEDLPLAYRAADLTVVPSVALEGFGLVAAESLAAGTPAMVAPVGGLPDLVRPICPELVLAASTVSALASGLRAFLTGRQHFPNDDDCRRYARENFDWRQVAASVAKVYSTARV